MGNLKPRRRFIAQLALSTAAFLACGALAQGATPVNGYVIINPISVCSGLGVCAPYGVSCTSASGIQVCTLSPAPGSATATTPIGFVDADTNVNLTRAFWAQAGIDVAFFPVQSYSSPTNNIDPSWKGIKDAVNTSSTFSYLSTDYTQLHQVNISCADGTTVLASPDFQTLTQHSVCTEHGGLSGTYSKLANPPSPLSSPPPLAINGCGGSCNTKSNALDVFFIDKVFSYPGSSSTIYGFSWVNGDGVSIVGSSTGNVFLTSGPRFDTLAHETGHNLGLDHLTFGANTDPAPSTYNSAVVGNMMLLGTTRATSANSGCLKETGTLSNPAPPPPVYNGGALYDLDYSTSTFKPCVDVNGNPVGALLADHLTPGSCTNLPSCNSQEGAAALSPFINTTLPNQANAGGGNQSPIAGAATTSTPSSSATPLAGTPAPLPMTITASTNPNDPNDQNTPDLASIIIAIQASGPLSFSGNQPVTQTGGTPKSPGLTCDANHLNNCAVTVTSVVKLSNQQVTGNPGCDSGTGQPPSSQCIKVTFSAGFGPGINVVLAVDFNKDAGVISSQNLLAGAQYTAIDSKGVATTTSFGNAVPAGSTNGVFTADSTLPDFKTPIVFTDLANFQNASAVKYSSPPFNNQSLSLCTPPLADPMTGAPTFQLVKIKGKLVPICPDGNISGGPD